jgi:AcrR family transcriptional regulator
MSSDTTAERIIASALASLLHKGVQKTTLADVAFQAGITRVTIYRYFGDKQSLVRAVCLRIAAIFQRAAQAGPEDTTEDINRRLSQMGDELGALPKGNLLGLFEEIHRRYPEVHEEFRRAREEAVDSIFQQALAAASREGALREGLHLEVLRAIFWAAVVNLLENPALLSSNVSLPEICTTVTEVFRHGILKEPSGDRAYENR